MGGISFIFSITMTTIIALALNLFEFTIRDLSILIFAFAFGAIGFLDDFIKVVLKQNQGLRAYQKFGLQLVVSAITICFLYFSGNISPEIIIPFSDFKLSLGIWYIPLMIFVILATVNAVNLTDGLDGLATSVTTIAVLAFATLAYIANQYGAFAIGIIIVASLLGFLIFNTHPAKVFMGDTGSLFLGGIIALFAICLSNPLIIILVGFIYLIETLSVIMQVIYFKATKGKRIFLMTPIHHHYEKKGWSEKKIVFTFTMITIITSALALIS